MKNLLRQFLAFFTPILYFLFLGSVGYAQSAHQLTLEDKVSMVNESMEVKLSESFIQELSDYASVNNIEPLYVMKYKVHWQVVFNDDLSIDRRVDYCNYLLRLVETGNNYLSLKLIEKQKQFLLAKTEK